MLEDAEFYKEQLDIARGAIEEIRAHYKAEADSLRSQLAEKEVENKKLRIVLDHKLSLLDKVRTENQLAAGSECLKLLERRDLTIVDLELKIAVLKSQLTSAQEEAWDTARELLVMVGSSGKITAAGIYKYKIFADWLASKPKDIAG